jgi:hypothetical protein
MIKKDKNMTSRRQFLKKAAYTAPSLLILGQLIEPTIAMAGKSGPGGGVGGGPLAKQSNARVKPTK